MIHKSSDIRYVEFRDLWRTRTDINISTSNPNGRYPLHLHDIGNLNKNGKSFLIWNAVIGSPGWWIVQHWSHAAVNDNVVFDIIGAGIISEDGDETW